VTDASRAVAATADLEHPDVLRLREVLATHRPARVVLPDDLGPFKAAAVLVPVVPRDGELHLLFTLRHADLRTHSGQISFPGGRVDDTDADHVAAALREADEELGIDPRTVHVLGQLGEVPTPSGYIITPVVGLVTPAPAAWRPSESEVAEVFEVSVSRLRDPALFEDKGLITRWGYSWRHCVYSPDGRNIWGATARMVNELLDLWR
jgi:8-oxo-dGTP pyrophosphatase MutT (NUDIX family)